uniref:Uncharacterized protein n=1 Tax=Arundo donax TaxID=35708 RepID=A0A0A9A339_ARUDO
MGSWSATTVSSAAPSMATGSASTA